MTVIGELNPDGTIAVEADECAITGGLVLGEHHVMQRFGATHFYRYLSDKEHLLTREKRAEIEALVKSSKVASPDKGKAKEISEA